VVVDSARRGSRSIVVLASLLAASASVTPLQAADPAQPIRVRVAAPGIGCPGIEGAFVALLDATRGFLLLAGHEFPGGRGPAVAKNGAIAFALPDGTTWTVDLLEAGAPSSRTWFARYPFRGTAVDGCVAFDRERFSSEGDIVSYVQWIVDEVYLKLPEEERRRYSAFSLSNRRIRLRVEREGFAPLALAGNEAAAMAFRFAGDERSALLVPYVLDEGWGRLAIEVALAADLTPPGVPRESLGFIVASTAQTVRSEALGVAITVEGLDPRP
jgi:hypothetical protein